MSTLPSSPRSGEGSELSGAAGLPNARFTLIPEAGHMPQIEQPECLLKLVWEFADGL